jgi:LssY-like putative type I secretion system component LssY/ankyrin repeat protein
MLRFRYLLLTLTLEGLIFAQESRQTAAANADSGYEEAIPDEALAPAAVELDVSRTSPLIQALYRATRETKEAPMLARLADAKKLIANKADVTAVDAQGRTALHWAVFGSSYARKPAILVAYEEIADALIQRGVEINRQDAYNDTALDYMLYSPNFEMQTLLLEHGATSGVLPTVFQSGKRADLAPGQTIDVRLDVPLYSDRSRTGDPITGTVTYPLCKNGEFIACKKGELLLAPGTKINGTVLFAQKAPNKYWRPRLVLDFSNIVYRDGSQSPLYARVLSVDNARETVRNNEILGIIQPHAAGKASLLMSAVSAVNPIAGYTIKGVQTVYGLSLRREVLFPAGTDLQLQVVGPSMLKKEAWPGWPRMTVDAKLQELVAAAPLRTHAKDRTPSDITNLLFIGSKQQLVAAFGEAGWFEADDLNMRSATKTVGATIRQTGYSSAPVSTLMIDGRPPDLAFQKSLNTFAKRHHLRIWKQSATYKGREVWVGAATHDIAISRARAGTKWSHRIDPHIDRERDWVETDLLYIGTATGYADVDRPNAPKKAENATGDQILTDGKMSVLQLAGPKTASVAAR